MHYWQRYSSDTPLGAKAQTYIYTHIYIYIQLRYACKNINIHKFRCMNV
jgi:hypothetical protein